MNFAKRIKDMYPAWNKPLSQRLFPPEDPVCVAYMPEYPNSSPRYFLFRHIMTGSKQVLRKRIQTQKEVLKNKQYRLFL